MLARGQSARLGALLLLGAGLVGSWLFVRSSAGDEQSTPARPTAPLVERAERAEAPGSSQREAVGVPLPAASESELEELSAASLATTAREPDDTREKEFYARFSQAADTALLTAEAERILRGTGPDPEKVALLRCLHDRGVERSDELHLLALRELPDVSSPRGESVPSTVLLLLDRRAPTEAGARATLSRAAFEAPALAPRLRGRAAASFFRNASADELLARRSDLARVQDPLVLECALAALARNPNTEAASTLLTPYGRTPAPPLTEGEDAP